MRPAGVGPAPSGNTPGPNFVAVDWGTTSLRAYRMQAGVVLQHRSTKAGVGTLEQADYPGRLAGLLRAVGAKSGLVLVSGMAGSATGWLEVACVALPANAASLAEGVLRLPHDVAGESLSAFDVHLVPGVADIRAGRLQDVMRGEEVEFLGADSSDGLTVLPGSHSKWVQGRDGSISAFTTFLTGETFHALGRHTLLRRSLPPDLRFGEEQHADFIAGVQASADDLLGRLFTVRVRGLNGADPRAGAAWLSGLLIGSEIRAGLRWAGATSRVRVGGGEPLQHLYRSALQHLEVEVHLLPAFTAARGLTDIARVMEQR